MSDFDEYKTYGNKAMGGRKEIAIFDAKKTLPEGTPFLLIEGVGYWAWIYSKDLESCLSGSVAFEACKA